MIKRFCDRPGCNNEVHEDELSKVASEYIPIIDSYLVISRPIRHDICAKCMTEFVTDFWYAKEI